MLKTTESSLAGECACDREEKQAAGNEQLDLNSEGKARGPTLHFRAFLFGGLYENMQ